MVKQNNSGQVLLIILLIMAVALTVGLSVVSRSITDIRISQEQEESARAFSAAEAGLESLLATGGAPGSIGDFTVTTDTRDLGNSDVFVFPGEGVAAGDIQTVWLVGHNSDGDPDPGVDPFDTGTEIIVFWGNEGTPMDQPDTPALEATFFYKLGNSFETKKYTSDPSTTGRRTQNGFAEATNGPFDIGGETFQFQRSLTSLPNNMYVLRLKLIYSDSTHNLGVQGIGDDLPLQGNCYESTASSGTTGIASKVEQCQLYPSLPGMFDYVLYSESNL